MKIKISKQHTIRILLFIVYNLTYVMFTQGYINQSINLAVLFCIVLFNLVSLFVKFNGTFKKAQLYFWDESKLMLFSVLTFAIISLIIQISHKRIELSYLSSYLYLILPVLFAFTWVNTEKSENLMIYFYIFLGRFILSFLLNNINNLSINAIKMISFSDSQSSMFESSDAHGFFILIIVFLSKNKKVAAWVSAAFCLLTFKRLSFILTPVLLLGFKFISQKMPSKGVVRICKCFFIVSPFILSFLLKNVVTINEMFGLDLDLLTTGRFSIVSYVLDNMKEFNGFGSISAFMKEHPWGQYITVTQMHCDVLQLYFETTILGVIVYFNNLFNMGKKDYIRFFLILYFAFEMLPSHFIDVLYVWMLLYMFMAMQDTQQDNKNTIGR